MIRLDTLPDELIIKLLSYLLPQDLARCALVNKRFKRISEDNALWEPWVLSYFPAWELEFAYAPPTEWSKKEIFSYLYMNTFFLLSPEVRRFFSAVLSNNLSAVTSLLHTNPNLLAAECARHHNAIYYAIAYQRTELLCLLKHFNTQHQVLSDEALLKAGSEGLKTAEEISKAELNRPFNMIFQRCIDKYYKNRKQRLKKETRLDQLVRQRKYFYLLALFSLALLGFGISLLAAPLLTTAIGSAAVALGISATVIATLLFIGTLFCLNRNKAWQHLISVNILLEKRPQLVDDSTSTVNHAGVLSTSAPSQSPSDENRSPGNIRYQFFQTNEGATEATSRTTAQLEL